MIRKYSLKKDGMTKLSEHFLVKEFACKDGSDLILIDDELVEVLESLRMWLGRPIIITSGYRTQSYNQSVGGAKHSYHVQGMAADIQINSYDYTKLAIAAAMQGARGIIVYKNFVHVDTREERYIGING